MQKPPLAFDSAASRQQVQRQLAALFAQAGSEAAMVEARMILCAALNIDHAALLREAEHPIGPDAPPRIADLLARRMKHEPVSRILGHREFWGLDLGIAPEVLDPRPDTETVVEAVIAAMESRRDAPLRILDLGTGSGALLCAMLASFPQAFGIGVDVSEAACKVAAKNLAALGFAPRGDIVCGDWTRALRGGGERRASDSLATSRAEAKLRAGVQENVIAGTALRLLDPGSSPAKTGSSGEEASIERRCSFDVIVSNPPYIEHGDIAALDPRVRDYDPHLALDGGADGYAAYRALIPALPSLLADSGVAVFELGIGQAEGVGTLFRAAGLVVTGTRRDLAGIERAIVACRHART